MTPAQRRALLVVNEGRCWRWTSTGKWCNHDGIHGHTLNNLLRRGLIELGPTAVRPAASWMDAHLTPAGEAALERRRA